uniref:Envelope glycoprotein n=1 Tax=Buteo japonicus TaxID=224669 RepID=A0A8C0B611_9AVES
MNLNVKLLVLVWMGSVQGKNLHQPYEWTLSRWEDSAIIQKKITAGSPSFTASLCTLAPISPCLDLRPFYFCPSSNPGKGYCNTPNQYYCAYWDCVTIANAWTPPTKDKFLKVEWGPHTFLSVMLPEDPGWLLGKTWGVRYWEPWPSINRGGLILIQKKEIPNSQAIGPNRVIKGTKSEPKKEPNRTVFNLSTLAPKPTLGDIVTKDSYTEPLWKLVQAAYQALNHTDPNATVVCWLCYDTKPPFYEAIGMNTPYNLTNQANPLQCRWEERRIGITLKQVRGKGICLGRIPRAKKGLCSSWIKNVSKTTDNKWVIPGEGGWWICSKTGLTPCLSLNVFNKKKEYCIQVTVIPRILYHQESNLYTYWEDREHRIRKREPITAITIATLIGLGVTGAATGITSIIQQNQGLTSLRAASISYLEKSLTSLSEVVLQNRRGLDLLFLQQGGLYAALGEECCFYADHTGVVRDSLAKVREGIAQRKREREARQGWFESWFNQSPWMTTLISTLMGPLIILLLTLTFGPCILNEVIALVQSRIESIRLMVLRQQYNNLDKVEEIESESEITPIKRTLIRLETRINAGTKKENGGL